MLNRIRLGRLAALAKLCSFVGLCSAFGCGYVGYEAPSSRQAQGNAEVFDPATVLLPLDSPCESAAQCALGLECSGVASPLRCALPLSCKSLLEARPGHPDGVVSLQPDRTGINPPFEVFCDMQRDGGGWMLIRPEMVTSSRDSGVTSVVETDAAGGLVLTVYANYPGCGPSPLPYDARHLDERVPWTQIRYTQLFVGRSVCFSIFGDETRIFANPPNLLPWTRDIDAIRDEVRMSVETDAFDGTVSFCQSAPSFWNHPVANLPRQATVILRRKSNTTKAGFGTGVSCTDYGRGSSGPTWWRYSEIYVR